MRRTDLIVPIRDRRKRKRRLTLKNLLNALLVILVVFAVITIRSEMHHPEAGEYGRIVAHEIPRPVAAKLPQIATEISPIEERIVSDPMLVAPMRREGWLHVTHETPARIPEPKVATAATSEPKGRLTIVGGPDGVALVRRDRRPPELSGGFGR